MTPSAQLVVGCSEQLPNEVRAYRRLGTSSDGAVLLSRHGATYTAAHGEVCAYGEMLERMLGLVLKNLPLDFHPRARAALTRRWNRDWGVEAEDLIQAEAAGDMDPSSRKPPSPAVSDLYARMATRRPGDQAGMGSFPASERRLWISEDGWRPPATSDDPDGGQDRERARRRRHIDESP